MGYISNDTSSSVISSDTGLRSLMGATGGAVGSHHDGGVIIGGVHLQWVLLNCCCESYIYTTYVLESMLAREYNKCTIRRCVLRQHVGWSGEYATLGGFEVGEDPRV
jgi:hypothetical protein